MRVNSEFASFNFTATSLAKSVVADLAPVVERILRFQFDLRCVIVLVHLDTTVPQIWKSESIERHLWVWWREYTPVESCLLEQSTGSS